MFDILPVAVDYQARRYPVVTFTLMGLNAVLYLLSLYFFFAPPKKSGTPGSLIYLFMPAFFHFVGNMIYLFLFGACVEDLMGRLWFTLFYLGGGLLANLTQVLLTTGDGADIPIVGASGAISACIGGFLIVLAKTRINFRWFFWFWFRIFNGEFWMAAWIVITFWFLMDFGSLILELGFSSGGGGGVAFGAHVGGTAAGALTMWLVRKKLPDFDEDEAPVVGHLRPVPVYSGSEPATIYLSTG